MAITRLTDLVTVFESKWVYGDVKFGYDGEVNQDHDTKYPLMLIQPPTSVMPVIYEGREEYEFEMNFYNLYSQDAQSVVELQKRWDNLQDLANEWLDFVLKNYQDSTVEAYLSDESIEIERVKDVANDKLVQIKITFTMSGFTKCFRPTSNFPTDYSDLVGWLSADSLATFDIPNKRVSLLGDRSGFETPAKVIQAVTTKQPLRIGFDGINDKTYLSFNGTTQGLKSSNNLQISGDDFTIFEVSKFAQTGDVLFSYEYSGSGAKIEISLIDVAGTDVYQFNSNFETHSSQTRVSVASGSKNKPHIGVTRRTQGEEATQLSTDYYDATNTLNNKNSATTYNGTKFNDAIFYVGHKYDDSLFLDGEFNELIIYNRSLTDVEVNDVVGYLNYKYKIY